MLILMGLWLARWHTATFFRLADLVLRGLTLPPTTRADVGPGGFSSILSGLSERGHEVPVHSVLRMWYVTPRLAAALWLVRWIIAGGDHGRLLPTAPPGVLHPHPGAAGPAGR